MNRRSPVHLLGAAVLVLIVPALTADDVLARFTPRIHTSDDGGTLPYRWYLPANAAALKKIPLAILLHGTSGRGTDNERQFTGANRTAITFLWAQGEHPCAIAVPQCPPDDQWTRTTYHPERHERTPEPGRTMQRLIALIRSLTTDPLIDPSRVYVIGNSMGGYGTWDLLSRQPTLFAAAVPICGGASLDTAPALVAIPLWIFHGVQDGIVVVGHSQRMAAALKQHGAEPRYSEFPDAGHEIADRVFADSGLAEWLFAQRRR